VSDLREPNFELENDLFVRVTEQSTEKDTTEGLNLRANVLIFSYNRPKMLREAIESVLSQDYGNFDLYIVDDGSDIFDPLDLVNEYTDERILIAQAPKIPIEERIKQSRLGRNANAVIETLPDIEPVYYLCDDDLMGPLWLSRSIRAFQSSEDVHVVQGESWYFNDGEDWRTESQYGMPTDGYKAMPTMYWGTGSFAHRALCSKQEGIWWADNTFGHSQDTNFIMDFWNSHSDYGWIPTPALYRREHENTLSAKLGRKDENGKYEIGFIPPPATKEMFEHLEN
jgi:glycosyltransferase involved in cell wall biosynthesis